MVVDNGRRRPTIEDVAAAAGVSRGTVSRVLNGGVNVSPTALAAVNKAIKHTGYVVNTHARSLVTQRSGSVAFILSEPQEKFFEDPNFQVLLRGCTQALAEHASLGIPAVTCGLPIGHEFDLAYVAVNEAEGGRLATAHLARLGRRRIATVTGPLDTPGGRDRLKGYQEGLEEAGLPLDQKLVVHGDYTRISGQLAMEKLLKQDPDLDAVFVASDLMALGAMDALERAGRSVPGDVAVVGFDDSPSATSARPALTTVRQPFKRICEEMVRLLLALLDGQEPAAVILPAELVIRETA